MDPVEAVGLELRLELGDLAPPVEVEVLPPGLARVRIGLDVHDLGHLPAEHGEGAADVDDADRLVKLVEDQDVSAQRRRQAAAVSSEGGWSKLEAHTPARINGNVRGHARRLSWRRVPGRSSVVGPACTCIGHADWPREERAHNLAWRRA